MKLSLGSRFGGAGGLDPTADPLGPRPPGRRPPLLLAVLGLLLLGSVVYLSVRWGP